MQRKLGPMEPASEQVRPRAAARRSERLQEVILLAGAVRANQLRVAAGGAMLQLPFDESGATLADHWANEISELGERLGRTLSVRIMVDQNSALFQAPADTPNARFCIEKDPKDYRGTGGVLRDLSDRFEGSDDLLVLNGTQLMVEPLADQVEDMWQSDADVVIIAHRGGTPCGLMLVGCEALSTIAPQGFVDMKEQALPQIAKDRGVQVIQHDLPVAMPIRTLPDYMDALRLRELKRIDSDVVADPFSENLSSTFTIIDKTASVDASARIHDSVVMAGARVMPKSVVVRSVVGPGAIVARGRQIVDQVVSAVGVQKAGAEQ